MFRLESVSEALPKRPYKTTRWEPFFQAKEILRISKMLLSYQMTSGRLLVTK